MKEMAEVSLNQNFYSSASVDKTGIIAAEQDGFQLAEVDAILSRNLARALSKHFAAHSVSALSDDIISYCLRSGKRVRPMLYLDSRKAFAAHGGSPLTRKDLAVAAGLELLHCFILVHDDIIDRSDKRRGQPSLHKLIENRLNPLCDRERAGQSVSLVVGDILFALAQKSILESGVPHAAEVAASLLDFMVDTGVGEIADIIFGTQDLQKVGMDDIEWMYWLKTTRYTVECPLTLAAIVSGFDDTIRAELARIIAPAGLAFQIENDLKDYRDFEVSDTAVPEDILEGKKTAVVRKAFDLLGTTDRTFLQICLGGRLQTEATVGKIRELIFKSGALPAMRAESDRLIAESFERMKSSMLPDGIISSLETMLKSLRKVVTEK